jgi:hypothetical protein
LTKSQFENGPLRIVPFYLSRPYPDYKENERIDGKISTGGQRLEFSRFNTGVLPVAVPGATAFQNGGKSVALTMHQLKYAVEYNPFHPLSRKLGDHPVYRVPK